MKRSGAAGRAAVMGPVLDVAGLAAVSRADRDGHRAGRDGDACSVARLLASTLAEGQ